MTGQAVEIPWAPGANYTRIICRLGEPRPDGADAEEYPDLMTQGGSVTLTCTAKRIRYAEEDGRSRMLTTRPWTFKVRLSDGELYNPESGNVGVKILSGSSAGVDPAGFTWTATVTPDNGESWSCTIPPTAGAIFDLVSNADVVAPNPGESTLSARVAALEASSGGGGIDTEAVQDVVGSMVTGAGGTYDDDAGTITLPSGGAGAVDSVNGQTGIVTLDAADVGALPDTYSPDLSGYATTASLADVATTGSYDDLSGKPVLGTAAATDWIAYASAAQGALADTALQPSTGQAIEMVEEATYTPTAADAGKLLAFISASANTITVPANVFTAGQRVDVLDLSAGGRITFVAGAGMTLLGTPSLVSRAQYSAHSIIFINSVAAVVVGDLA